MSDTVTRWHEGRHHDASFRDEVERALQEAEDPAIERIPHDTVASGWRQQRAELERRASGRPA